MPATASSWRSPPDSALVSRPSSRWMPAWSATSRIRSRISSRGMPKFSGPNASSASTVAPTICLAGSCNTVPTVLAKSRKRNSRVS